MARAGGLSEGGCIPSLALGRASRRYQRAVLRSAMQTSHETHACDGKADAANAVRSILTDRHVGTPASAPLDHATCPPHRLFAMPVASPTAPSSAAAATSSPPAATTTPTSAPVHASVAAAAAAAVSAAAAAATASNSAAGGNSKSNAAGAAGVAPISTGMQLPALPNLPVGAGAAAASPTGSDLYGGGAAGSFYPSGPLNYARMGDLPYGMIPGARPTAMGAPGSMQLGKPMMALPNDLIYKMGGNQPMQGGTVSQSYAQAMMVSCSALHTSRVAATCPLWFRLFVHCMSHILLT